jgi:hypothetical protein
VIRFLSTSNGQEPTDLDLNRLFFRSEWLNLSERYRGCDRGAR